MKNDNFNSHYQVEILNSVSIKDITANYILGCNKVYYIYANYGLLYLLSDELNTNPSCKLNSRQFNYRYEKLRSSDFSNIILEKNNNSVCSYCLSSKAEQVDHYLTKSHYPSYSVVYNNLIPSCYSCNHKKRDDLPKDEVWFIQPNFEKIPESFFLDVCFDLNYRIVFKVPHIHKNDNNHLLMKKIEYTFNHLPIFEEYSRLANQELLSFIREFLSPYNRNANLSEFLKLKFTISCQEPNMLWKRSLYNFLRYNKDFIRKDYMAYAQKFGINQTTTVKNCLNDS